MNIKSIKNKESFSILVNDKILCSMATGGCHRFPTELEAEVFGRNYLRGYNAGSYLDSDIENFITD